MEITFSNPVYLFFLVSIPFLIISHFFTMRYLKRRALKFANFEAIKRVTGGEKSIIKNSIFLSTNYRSSISKRKQKTRYTFCPYFSAFSPTKSKCSYPNS